MRSFFVIGIISFSIALPVATHAVDRIAISDTTVTVIEDGDGVDVTVTLDEPIIGDPDTVTIPVSVSDASEVSVSTDSLVWSSAEWGDAKTITITPVDDSDPDGDIESTIILGAAVSGSEYYANFDPADIAVTTTDNEFLVTKTTDTADGTCDADCSLREAVIATNAQVGRDTIILPSGTYTLSIAGTGEDSAATGDLDFTDADTTTIESQDDDQAGTIIDANGIDRVIDVRANASANFNFLTIQGGSIADNGAGIRQTTDSTVGIHYVTVTGNTSTGGNYGGGLYCSAATALFITRSTISTNSAGYGGGVFVQGCDTLWLYWSDVEDNTAATDGGGVYINKGSLDEAEIIDTDIDGNTATRYGGGVALLSGSSTATEDVALSSVTVSNNSVTDASGTGGGLYIETHVHMDNVTVYGNTSAGDGGGLSIYDQSWVDLTMNHATIAGNTAADDGGGIFKYEFGTDSTETISNSIISDNTATGDGPDVYVGAETLGSGDYNLIGDSTGSNGSFAETNDEVDVDTGLDLTTGLSDRDGDVLTIPLESDSLAKDTIPEVACLNADGASLGQDARHKERPQGSGCDAGAYEYDQTAPTIVSFTPADNATGIAVDSNLTIAFDEEIFIGTGNVRIYKTYNDELVETIDITSEQVTQSTEANVVINPSADLQQLVEYYVQVDATALDDIEGNSYAGISDTTTWSFTTTGTAGVTVGDMTGPTTEAGGTSTFVVVLNTEPTADVTMSIISSDTTEATVSVSSLTFSSANWNEIQTVTVTGVNDDVDDGDIAYTIQVGSTLSADVNYNNINPNDPSATNTDNDTASITKDEPFITVQENGFIDTIHFRLTSEPTADVVITATYDTDAIELDTPTLTFTSENWDTTQSFIAMAVDDSLHEDEEESVISFSAASEDPLYDDFTIVDLTATILDNDIVGISVGAISGDVSESGTTATFTVVLDTEPTADVVMHLLSNDSEEAIISASTITFTSLNWDEAQTITVTGVADGIDDGDQEVTIILQSTLSLDDDYSGIDPTDVNVTTIDVDSGSITVSEMTDDTLEVEVAEGEEQVEGIETFTVGLSTAPTADVTIAVTSSDTTEGTVSPSLLTFTADNWETDQTVTVTGVDDYVDDGDIAYTIILAAAESEDTNFDTVNPSDVSVTNIDNDTASATVYPDELYTTEGAIIDGLYIILGSQPTADVVFDFTVENDQVTMESYSMTFTSENWDEMQSIYVTPVDDDIAEGEHSDVINWTVSSEDPIYDAFDPSYRGVTIFDNDIAGVTLNTTELSVTEGGGAAVYTVVLDSEPTADVIVSISGGDEQITLSDSELTFTADNWSDAQQVSVSAVDDASVETTTVLTLQHILASEDVQYNEFEAGTVSVTVTDNDAANDDDSDDSSDDSSEDDIDNDAESGEGDGSDDTEDTLGVVESLTRLSNNTVQVTYENGSTKTFQLFPNGSAKAKVQLHTNGNILIAINKKYIRTYDAFTGDRLYSKKLFKKKQYKTKFKRYNVYKNVPGKNNIMVLAQTNKKHKKQFKLKAFVVQAGGKIVVRNTQSVITNKNTAISKLNTKKNNKNGKKARIIVTRKGKNLADHTYKVTKKKGRLAPAE